ncbi:hypothetical protein D3C76_826380 [compost metagenome]|jgi:hypothetical protein|uniref:Uncharacterized protein n=1 Tax=Pseudomonas umsongensis TaxID=198618 RepID=A0AAE6ZVR2_9PSED|nr:MULTISPECIES: hypothetical protein [Pseudomonas]KEX90774.1 hypothetical protein HA62_28960 [Pseudomonas putida]EPA93998.1 hypothetical protein PG5_55390 [Pseudomonas sp. G5(2012)]MBT9574774.1 hypothetical protein [Pseudomonas umsongensis]OXR34382.1 hypothetical protein PSUM_00290 [Pseudomonas umsongensis]QFG29515.1 hypothetical protein F6476_10095 [Pseudomonas umsongensis]
MSDEIDIPEPEHDHLLDHEFHDEEAWVEQDAQGILDDEEDEDEEDDDLDYLDQIDQEDD